MPKIEIDLSEDVVMKIKENYEHGAERHDVDWYGIQQKITKACKESYNKVKQIKYIRWTGSAKNALEIHEFLKRYSWEHIGDKLHIYIKDPNIRVLTVRENNWIIKYSNGSIFVSSEKPFWRSKRTCSDKSVVH